MTTHCVPRPAGEPSLRRPGDAHEQAATSTTPLRPAPPSPATCTALHLIAWWVASAPLLRGGRSAGCGPHRRRPAERMDSLPQSVTHVTPILTGQRCPSILTLAPRSESSQAVDLPRPPNVQGGVLARCSSQEARGELSRGGRDVPGTAPDPGRRPHHRAAPGGRAAAAGPLAAERAPAAAPSPPVCPGTPAVPAAAPGRGVIPRRDLG